MRVSKPDKKSRSVNIALSVVGIPRPPTYGNLPGYFNCTAQLFSGLPVDFLLEVQNDGHSPDLIHIYLMSMYL